MSLSVSLPVSFAPSLNPGSLFQIQKTLKPSLIQEAGWTALHFAVSGGFVEVVSLSLLPGLEAQGALWALLGGSWVVIRGVISLPI